MLLLVVLSYEHDESITKSGALFVWVVASDITIKSMNMMTQYSFNFKWLKRDKEMCWIFGWYSLVYQIVWHFVILEVTDLLNKILASIFDAPFNYFSLMSSIFLLNLTKFHSFQDIQNRQVMLIHIRILLNGKIWYTQYLYSGLVSFSFSIFAYVADGMSSLFLSFSSILIHAL